MSVGDQVKVQIGNHRFSATIEEGPKKGVAKIKITDIKAIAKAVDSGDVREALSGVRELSLFAPTSSLASVSAGASTSNAVATEREWNDASGKFSITATFVSHKDGSIELRKANGKLLRVPLDKLSEADKKYVAWFESGATADSENPYVEIAPKPRVQGLHRKAIRRRANKIRGSGIDKWAYTPPRIEAASPIEPKSASFDLDDLPNSRAFL